MTDEHAPTPARSEPGPETERAPSADLDLTGDATLDDRLAEPILKGTSGIETAQAAAAAFIIVLAALLAFSNTLAIPFNSIERDTIVAADAMHSPITAPAAWRAIRLEPLTVISLATDWALSDGAPLFMRLVGVLIHALNGVLVFLIARRVTGIHGSQLIPAAAGVLFAIHPAVTESVNLLTNRGVLLGAFWLLLACVMFLRAASGERLRTLAFAIALVSYALAFAAWPQTSIGVVLFAALGLCLRESAPLLRLARVHAPFWILAIALWIATAATSGFERSIFDPALSLNGLVELSKSFIYPPSLSVAHPETVGMLGFWILVAFTIVGILLILAFGAAGFALTWLAATLAVATLIPIDRSAAAETALYLPIAGLAFIVPLLLRPAPQGPIRSAVGIAVALVAVVCGQFTYLRNQDWQSETDLWTDARGDCPTCVEPLLALGGIYIEEGEAALQQAQQSIAAGNAGEAANLREVSASFFRRARNVLDDTAQIPNPPVDALVRLGTVQRYQAEPDAARQTLTTALRRDPENYRATVQLALLTDAQAAQSGQAADYQRAIELYGRAGQLGPLSPELLVRYAAAWQELENYERVAAALREPGSLEASPAVPAMMNKTQQQLAAVQAAQQQAGEIARTNPNSPDLLAAAARTLYWRGNYLQAAYLIETLFRNRAPDRDLWLLLGVSKSKMDAFERFLEAWPSPPGAPTPSPWDALARQAAEANEWQAAQLALRQTDDATLVEYRFADIATAIGQTQRAVNYLREAAQARPTDPEPWLRLCELVLPFNQKDAVAEFLAEAETRGAPAERIADIRTRAGITGSGTTRNRIE